MAANDDRKGGSFRDLDRLVERVGADKAPGRDDAGKPDDGDCCGKRKARCPEFHNQALFDRSAARK